MLVPGPAKKIIIHLSDDTVSRHDFLYKEIIALLLERGVAGASVLHPVSGFGSHHRFHEPGGGIDADRHLPVRVEFIDSEPNVQALLPSLFDLVGDSLIEAQDTTILKVR